MLANVMLFKLVIGNSMTDLILTKSLLSKYDDNKADEENVELNVSTSNSKCHINVVFIAISPFKLHQIAFVLNK